MSGPVLAKIYLGQITKWNDPAIKKLNPGKNLPSTNDHGRPPLGRLGHDATTSPTISPASAPPGRRRSARARRSTGPPASARRTAPAWLPSSSRRPAGSATRRRRIRAKNHIDIFKMQNRSGKFVIPRLKGILAAAPARHASGEGRLALDRQPAQVQQVHERLPDLDLHVRDRGEEQQERRGAQEAHRSGRSPRARRSGRRTSSSRSRRRSWPSTRRRSRRSTRRENRSSGRDLSRRDH